MTDGWDIQQEAHQVTGTALDGIIEAAMGHWALAVTLSNRYRKLFIYS